MKKYFLPLMMLVIFETIAITLWLTKNNPFYLFNFSYIGISISSGIFLYVRNYKYERSFWSGFICLFIWALFAAKICRLRDFGIIFLRACLKPQRFIMRWPKFLVRFFLAEVGVGMLVGRQWRLIFSHTKFRKHQEKRLGG